MVEGLWVAVLMTVLALVAWKVWPLKRITVYQYQKALKYSKGIYVTTLSPGQYWIWPVFTSLVPVDVRTEFLTIPGQDVVSADGVALKVSLAVEFEVTDPNVAINKHANFRTSLYLTLQMALREVMGREKIDVMMENRSAIGTRLKELTSTKAAEYGVKLISADAKDLMFPGEMKKAFSQVVKAQKEGQAALERARGETAALRSLANAARMMDDNPKFAAVTGIAGAGRFVWEHAGAGRWEYSDSLEESDRKRRQAASQGKRRRIDCCAESGSG